MKPGVVPPLMSPNLGSASENQSGVSILKRINLATCSTPPDSWAFQNVLVINSLTSSEPNLNTQKS